VQERIGLKIKSSENFITNALERGKTAEVFAANERNYLQAKEAKGECCVIVYLAWNPGFRQTERQVSCNFIGLLQIA